MSVWKHEAVASAYCASRSLQCLGCVGLGAFKETYRAIDAAGQSIAVKIFNPGVSAERSKREIDAMQRCNISSIACARTIAEYSFNGLNYLVLEEEYLEGGTLSQKIEGVRLPVTEVLRIANEIVSAISHLDELRLVHRDIKPDNIMFRASTNEVVLVDLGLVRDLGAQSLTGTWFAMGPGTPLYSSPEQLNNQKALIDWRSDQFSLGVTLSIAAIGMHPYQAHPDSPDQIVAKVFGRAGVDPMAASLLAHNGLDVIARMVSPWPVERYRTVTELRKELKRS